MKENFRWPQFCVFSDELHLAFPTVRALFRPRFKMANQLMNPADMPPPAPRRRQGRKVLEEEDYVDAIGRIIERDFFPNLQLTTAQANVSSRTLCLQ